MKFDTIASFATYLEKKGFTSSTATTYRKAVAWLLSDQFILVCKDMDISKVMARLRTIRHKSDYSKHKNAFL